MSTTARKIFRRGFTLIEAVTVVGIMGAMAAVVIPQVVRQFDKAEPARLQSDMKNLQTAIETFNVNVKAPPGDLDDLANQITTADTLLSGATTLSTFTSPGHTTFWRGPYVDFALVDIVNGSGEATRPTAFGALVQETFVCYNSLDNSRGTSIGTAAAASACPNNAGQKFLAIQITGLATLVTDANFDALNDLFDDPAEATPGTMGRVRFAASGSTTGGSTALTTNVVYFLATPLN